MKRLYKVFLVEDEIVIRRGIRERIDWQSAGFEFSGEAPDGEVALPLLQESRPDILITDIKMPFMNGLELCRIVRETMPGIKIIILSGHDEFAYAREAIKLGVTEYLLKPLSAQDLLDALLKVAQQIDKENAEREQLYGLQQQVEDNLPMLREKFLLRLILGGVSPAEALEKSIQLKLDLIARCYQVILIKAEYHHDQASTFDYPTYQSIEQVITQAVNRHSDIIVFKKGLEETVLILKGESPSNLEQDSYLLAEAIRLEVVDKTNGKIQLGISQPCDRLGEISKAFFEASNAIKQSQGGNSPPAAPGSVKPIEILKLEHAAAEKFLKYGAKTDFNQYFDAYIHPIHKGERLTRLILEYIVLDLLITAANFVNELGGDAGDILPELSQCEQIVTGIHTIEDVRQLAQVVLSRVLDFRDQHAGNPYSGIITRSRAYIDVHFTRSTLSLSEVAMHVNLSPSHFSLIFSRETGETFIEYLTRKRIEKSRELLCSTALKTSEISAQIGYDNPHYFSTVFKKVTGMSPTEYRLHAHQNG